MKKLLFLIFITIQVSCQEKKQNDNSNKLSSKKESTFFKKIDSKVSNINFTNYIKQTANFNFMHYTYIYTGAGVAVGDIDNDGLEDIYFVSNFGPNKLYKNNGNFEFEDITSQSKTEDYTGLASGVTMLDINNDGWLDIYLCKVGSLKNKNERRNKLFVNQKDGTFIEEAKKWGIDDPSFSTQIYQIDFDRDGDLDLYLVNHRYDFMNTSKALESKNIEIEEITSDQLFRNDGDIFTKVTKEAGLQNKTWGLSAVIADFNEDGWDDIFVANDFYEGDFMYINQKDGTFKNEINKRLNHITTNSMGSDYADLNNDLKPDLFTVDMAPESHTRSKENMASMSTPNFWKLVKSGNHYQYMSNMLHYNLGKGFYKESAQLSGVSKTDWSWGPLIADFDNDGLKDIFITNGVDKEYTNRDAKKILKKLQDDKTQMTIEGFLSNFPSEKINNYIFKNNGDLSFENKVKEWGIDTPSFSFGSTYADLDNDGDLDLIINNVEDQAGIYRNNSSNNFIRIKLKGTSKNPFGIGTKVYINTKNEAQVQELRLTRGYKSSVSNILNFGLGKENNIAEINIVWPDGKTSKLQNIKANQLLTVDYSSATSEAFVNKTITPFKKSINPTEIGIHYQHQENDFNDFSVQLLLPQKQSTKGTGIAVADVNGDGLEDFFVGNALGSKAALYIQNNNGTFSETNKSLWKKEAKYEDANALFFDADGDGDQDLYVVSTGYELDENNSLLQDRLYINNGKGNFKLSKNALPKMLSAGKSVITADYDKDGDLDLFIGGNVVPGKYPLSPHSYLLKNENGKFSDITSESLQEAGMISQAIFTDYDNDKDLDLLLVGEWMAPTIFTNNDGNFEKNNTISGFENQEGWWFSVTASDFDGDGDQDYVFGNLGKNNKFHPTSEKPLYIYAKDFDENGSFDVAMSKINNGKLVPVRGKECSSEQNPFLLDKIGTYKEFASLDMEHIYGEEKLKDAFKLTAHNFKTIYVENLGNGKFKTSTLPNETQMGPTMSLINGDFNKDGNIDIMGIGNLYDAEVETIRYDSNYGYTLLGDGKGNFNYSKKYAPFIDSDAKDLKQIIINGKSYFIAVSNNAPLQIFSY